MRPSLLVDVPAAQAQGGRRASRIGSGRPGGPSGSGSGCGTRRTNGCGSGGTCRTSGNAGGTSGREGRDARCGSAGWTAFLNP